MNINTPYPAVRDDGEFVTRLNTERPGRPFVTIDLSEDRRTGLVITSADEADRLIRALEDARQQLLTATDEEA